MKIAHVLKSNEFADILSNGNKISGKIFSLYALKQPDTESGLSIGIIIPKKCIRLAVTRNYLRRTIYAFFNIIRQDCRKGFKIAVRMRVSTATKKKKPLSALVRQELTALTKKAGIYK